MLLKFIILSIIGFGYGAEFRKYLIGISLSSIYLKLSFISKWYSKV